MATYIINLFRDQKNKEEKLDTEPNSINSPHNLNNKSLLYSGNFKLFKQKFKFIHQTVSLFYYKDKNIHISYRILDVVSQFNLQLTLVILECFLLNNQAIFICIFIITNPILIFILRILFKIMEAIYRFGRIASAVSQSFLIIILVLPNLILIILYQYSIILKSEYYVFYIIYLGNTIISQVLIEPITIFIRIYIYRQISSSLKNMDLNPKYHLMHFFIIHSCLEDIFEEFTRI
ncbi:unnamed protein product [Paramecium pentaurelia]|uniref:Transmembrane protein n=1 Tax=Paramecium pentaurelia TaxID=43138 RepID=A0A8S1XT93_9CILI|nr:unnamed protein product [Paramecium pentaurelia]